MKGKVGLLFLVLMGYAATMLAAPISENAARRKAVAFMTNKAQQPRATHGTSQARKAVSSSDLALAESRQAYYVFNMPSDEGYVIVSGDDRLPEVIGYSLTGTYDSNEMPENKRAWMEEYVRQYEYLQSHPEALATSQDATQREPVPPLLKCKFGQGTPFNNQCPTINGSKAPTGCAATAMAQIMHYYQWPKQTTKELPAYTTATRKISMPSIPVTTIDWDHILGEYNNGAYDSQQAEAVAMLMRLCGAALAMDYDLGGSGACLFEFSFQRFFGYGNQAENIYRFNYTADLWEQIIYNELASGRPVPYGGFPKVGSAHAFVVDGYNDGFFHVNFGWSGLSDDYFKMPNLGAYANGHDAIIGLQPDNDQYADFYSVLDNDKLTIYYDKEKRNRQGTVLNTSNWQERTQDITEFIIDPSFANYKPVRIDTYFKRKKNLKSIKGIEYLNTSYVVKMELLFDQCSSLTSLDVSGFNTQNVTNMKNMFNKCTSLTNLDVSNFNTQNVTDMNGMFACCHGLTSLDVSRFNTQNVTDMGYMFLDCSGLTSLDLSRFNTQNVTNMESMFYGCKSLANLDLSSFNTQNVTNMELMFYDCSLLKSLDMSGFNTQNVTNMSDMFRYCSGLTSLDVSRFNTQNVTTMRQMFDGCSGLTSLDVSRFDTQKVTDMRMMFIGCSGLTNLDVSGFDTQNVKYMGDMFCVCSGLTSLDVRRFNTQNVTDMNGMFCGCIGLTSLDVSSFNTQNVTDMEMMFYRCSGLTSLDLTNFNTQNVTNMREMFGDCSGLTSIDLSSFNTQNVTNMDRMFCRCSGLTSIDVSNFNTQNVTNMRGMFSDCSGLTSIDVSNFNTQNVTDMNGMFYRCSGLANLDLSVFNVQNVTDMGHMFFGCSGLTSLDLSNFNTQNVTNMSWGFFGCSGLTTIYADEAAWSTKNVQSGDVFSQCEKLVGGNGTVYSANHVDSEYARVDKEGTPGYFTQKTGTGIQLLTAKGQEGDVWHTLDGLKLMGKPVKKGVYILNGQKIVIK